MPSEIPVRVLTLLLLALCLLTQTSQAAIARAGGLAHFHSHDTTARQDHGHAHDEAVDHEHGDDHEHDHHQSHDSRHSLATDHHHGAGDDSTVYVDTGSDRPFGPEQVLKRLCADMPAPAAAFVAVAAVVRDQTGHGDVSPFRSRVPHPLERPPRA